MSDDKRTYAILRYTVPQFTLSQIFEIIILECENGCTDAASTVNYFHKHHLGKFNASELFVLATCLNFDTVRAQAPHIHLG